MILIRLQLDLGRHRRGELGHAVLADLGLHLELREIRNRRNRAALARRLSLHAEWRDGFADLRALLDDHAVERRPDVRILDRFFGDPHARARRGDRRLRRLDARGGDSGRCFRRGQRRGGGDAILHQRALPIQVAQLLVARRNRLTELRLAFRQRPPRSLELRVNHFAFAHARPLFESEARQPATHLDADVAAAPRDHVAARHQDRQRRRAARRRHDLGDARGVDLRRAPFGDVGAGVRIQGRPGGPEHDQHRPRNPAPAPAGVPVDTQARQVAGRRIAVNCHGRVAESVSALSLGRH